MCGIAGWAWKNPPAKHARRALAVALGVSNDTRGGRGFGVFIADKPKVWRGPETMAMFIGRNGTDWALARSAFLHTRLPSRGKVCTENSHPFTIGDITGAHNGIVSNHDDLNKSYDRKFEVDSMHIIAHLHENRPWKDLDMYGAVEWYDHRDRKIRLVHVNNGSLEVRRIPGHGIAWSSTAYHLKESLDSCGLLDKSVPLQLTSGMVYVIDSGNLYEDGRVETGRYTSRATWRDGYSGNGYCGGYSSDNEWRSRRKGTSANDTTVIVPSANGYHSSIQSLAERRVESSFRGGVHCQVTSGALPSSVREAITAGPDSPDTALVETTTSTETESAATIPLHEATDKNFGKWEADSRPAVERMYPSHYPGCKCSRCLEKDVRAEADRQAEARAVAMKLLNAAEPTTPVESSTEADTVLDTSSSETKAEEAQVVIDALSTPAQPPEGKPLIEVLAESPKEAPAASDPNAELLQAIMDDPNASGDPDDEPALTPAEDPVENFEPDMWSGFVDIAGNQIPWGDLMFHRAVYDPEGQEYDARLVHKEWEEILSELELAQQDHEEVVGRLADHMKERISMLAKSAPAPVFPSALYAEYDTYGGSD